MKPLFLVKCIKCNYKEDLTVGKIYKVHLKFTDDNKEEFYTVTCDNGEIYSKYTWKFEKLNRPAARVLYE